MQDGTSTGNLMPQPGYCSLWGLVRNVNNGGEDCYNSKRCFW